MLLPDTSTRVWLALAATALAGVSFGAPAANAATSGQLAVLSPEDESLETGAVDIKVRVPAGARQVRARVGARDVKLRGSGTVRTASVPVAKLAPGRASVTVRAMVKGKREFDHARIVVGTRMPSLLAAAPTVAQGRGTAALKLELRARPSVLRVTLNGKRVRALSLPEAGKASMPLAADEGLRFGANTVRVRGYDARTGRWARTTTRFTMGSGAPLASAGRDVRVLAGAKVKLSAAASVGRRDQLPLGYHWVVATKPRGAAATLRNANTKRPTIVTSNPGRYRIRLELSERGNGARAAAATAAVGQDVVSVDAAASIPPYGTPITTLVPNGNGTSRTTVQGIPINPDGKSDYIDTPDTMVQLTILSRSTLGFVSTTQMSADPVAILAAVNAVQSSQLAILTGAPGCCGWVSTTGPIFKPNAGFSLVFVGGSYANPIVANNGSPAVAWNSPQTNGAISGVIRKSHSMVAGGGDGFTYAATDGVRFDTYTDNGNGFTMTLGPRTAAFGGVGIAGMALAPDLKTVIWQQWFPITGDATADASTLESLKSELQAMPSYPGAVVALQTNGRPRAATTAWGEVGNALTPLGGTESVWNELDGTGDYALVGRSGSGASSALHAIASAEASGPLTNANTAEPFKATNGTLRGVLGRGTDALPIVLGATSLPTQAGTDPTNSKNTVQVNPFEMSALANAAPQPWPLTTPGQIAAYQNISQQLGLGNPGVGGAGLCYTPVTWDLRAEYCNADEKSNWAGFATDLTDGKTVTFPSNASGFTQTDFNAVVSQLQSEFAKISTVYALFDQLQAPILSTSTQTNKDVADATTAVETSLNSKTTDNAAVSMQSFMSDLAQPLQDVDDSDVALGVGLFASAADLALGAVADEDGDPALSTFELKKGAIANEAVTRLTTAATQMALVEQIILTDWTKLSTTFAYAKNAWSDNDWSSDAQAPVVQAGTRAWLYTTMLPMVYTQIFATPAAADGGNTVAGLNSISCWYNDNDTDYWRWPFRNGAVPNLNGYPVGPSLQASAVFAPLTATQADGTAVSPFVWGLGNPTGGDELDTPTAALTDPLFKPTSWTDGSGNPGLGLYPEQFYSWGWVNAPNRISWPAAKTKLSDPKKC